MAADYNQLINQTADAVHRIQAGDSSAWNECYELTKNTVYYRLRVSNVPEREIEDLMQEIYIKVFQGLSSQQDPQSAFKWIGTIAKNTVTDHYRKAVVKHEMLVEMKEDEDADDFFDREDDFMVPERIMEDRDLQREVRAILNTLPKAQYDALAEFYFNERSIQEIAALRGVPEGTVKSDLSRGRKAFREKVQTLEKKYGKLFALAPVFLLGFLFSEEAMAATVPAAVSTSVAGSLSAAGYLHSGAVGYANAGAAGYSNSGMAGYSNAGAVGASNMAAAPSAVGTAAGTAAASAGISKGAVAGIIIAISAAIAAGGTGVGIYLHAKQNNNAVAEASHPMPDDPVTIPETETELEGLKKPEAAEKPELHFVDVSSEASEEAVNPVPAQTEAAEPDLNEGFNQELVAELFPLSIQPTRTFSGYEDHGDYFSVTVSIGELPCLPHGRFDSMQIGDTVEILGNTFTKILDPEGGGQAFLRSSDDIIYNVQDQEGGFGTEIAGYDLNNLDVLFAIGEGDYLYSDWVENPTVVKEYTLNIRKDAELIYNVCMGELSGLAEPVFRDEKMPSDSYRDFLWAWIVFDENGLVKQLVEIFAS